MKFQTSRGGSRGISKNCRRGPSAMTVGTHSWDKRSISTEIGRFVKTVKTVEMDSLIGEKNCFTLP